MSSPPAPRLCHLVKWPDFNGFGFNLHAERNRSGQFIGQIDPCSPAEWAGLKAKDRIVEVNGVNVANENHRQVVERIKTIPDETKLLVVDEAADRWYKEKKMVVRSTQDNVLYIKTPVPRPSSDNGASEPPSYDNITVPPHNGTESGVNGNSNDSGDSPKTENKTNGKIPHHHEEVTVTPVQEKPIIKAVVERKDSPEVVISNSNSNSNGNNSSSKYENGAKPKDEQSSRSSTPMDGSSVGSTPDSPRSQKSSRSSGSGQNGDETVPDISGLNLNMSASEMRQLLASRKKADPKKIPMDIRQKYEIIQRM